MNTTSHSHSHSAPYRVAAWIVRLLWGLLKRGYAAGLILLVLWLSWRALNYLVSSLLLPARPPTQIVDIATRLSPASMIRTETAATGRRAATRQRAPLSHYHRLDAGYQSDRFNGCTVSQCHAPLPHGKNKADRAFLNMHATSVHCVVCHMDTEQKPLALAWYDLKTGKVRTQAPALLRTYGWLTRPEVRNDVAFKAKDQVDIVKLFRVSADEAYGNLELSALADHLLAVRVTSEEFTRLIKVARDTVQRHFRGEYGAKLTLIEAAARRPVFKVLGNDRAIRTFLAPRDSLSEEQKKLLLDQIHPKRRQPTLQCTQCHRPQGSLVDLEAVGYPPARIQALSSPEVTSAIVRIVEGKSFYLPDFMENRD